MRLGIFKNSLYLLIAQGLVKVIAFFYTIFLARNLVVEDFGLYVVALSYFSLFSAISDFGISRYLIREVAREDDRSSTLLPSVILLRLTVTAVMFFLFAAAMYLIDPLKIRVALTLMAVLAVLPQAITLTIDAIFIARQRLNLSAWAIVTLSLANLVVGVVLVRGGFGVWGAAAALGVSQLIYAGVAIALAWSSKIELIGHIPEHVFKTIIVGSLPYGLLAVLGLIYFRIDTVLLSYLRGSYEAGIYGAAYKFLEAIVFIPSSLSAALFPVIAKLHSSSLDSVRKLYFKTVKILGGLSLLVLVGFLLILPWLIKLLLPGYQSSITVVMILSLAIPFMFIHVPAAVVLMSTDKYLRQVLSLSIMTLLFNVLTNLIFIPIYGYLAAAWITVVSEILSFLVFFTFLQFKVFRS